MANYIIQALANPTITEGSLGAGSYLGTITSSDSSTLTIKCSGDNKMDFYFDGTVGQWDDISNDAVVGTIYEIWTQVYLKMSHVSDWIYCLLWNFNTSTWDEIPEDYWGLDYL